MLYLVSLEALEPQPEGYLSLFTMKKGDKVVPSVSHYLTLKEEGKLLAGGHEAARKAAHFVLEAKDHADVYEILRAFPFWSTCKWEVIPLVSFEHHVEIVKGRMERTGSPAVEKVASVA